APASDTAKKLFEKSFFDLQKLSFFIKADAYVPCGSPPITTHDTIPVSCLENDAQSVPSFPLLGVKKIFPL
ncbi:MAG: hypothetical protein IJD13_00405, partial [Oscillospiraceae bacterium]|nr:hypothetical protein [Oscillospiraceae bacterium]